MQNTMTLSRRALLSTAAATPILATPLLGYAATDAEARRKINLAGRQRMLTQRMSKAALMHALDVNPDAHFTMLKDAHALFDRTLAGLEFGDAELGLPPEEHQVIRDHLQSVVGLWTVFGQVIAGVIDNGSADDAQMATIAEMNPAVLAASDKVVQKLVDVYGNSDTSLGLAISINIAGRQRMFSQKMGKEAALIALDIDAASNRENLAETTRLFQASLKALMEGLPTISLPAPPAQIHAKLSEVKGIWEDVEETCAEIQSGTVERAALEKVARHTEPLLVTSNEAVLLYERLTNSV